VEEDWRKMRPSDWEVQQTLDEDDSSTFKTVKDVVGIGIRKWQEAYCAWNGEYPPSPGYRPAHCTTQSPRFPEEAATVDVALHGWRLQSVKEAGSWDF